VIVVIWRSNFKMVKRFRSFDSRSITCNIVLVGLVIFIPFTTQGMSDPEYGSLALPTALYAVNVAAAVLVQIVMYQSAISRGRLRVELPPTLRRVEFLDSLINPVILLVSVPIAFVFGGVAAKFAWILMAVLSPLSGARVRRLTRQALDAGEVTPAS